MFRATIGFQVPGHNRNLAGFARQVAFIEVLCAEEGFPRIEEETRKLRVHFSALDSIGIDTIDLYMTDHQWCLLRDALNQGQLFKTEGPT